MLNSYKLNMKSFQQLSKQDLYAILALRMEVFCVEQECPYQDLDYQDQLARHIFIKENGVIMAYARIINTKNNLFHIGRVVVKQAYRNKGLANIIMKFSIDELKKESGKIEISAQSYLKGFYQKLGFISTEKYYLEDDIPHESMHILLD